MFKNYDKQRSVTRYSKILNDVESHIRPNHPYRDTDKVTWAHETIHGINADIRNQQPEPWNKNAFYLLNNLAFVCEDPKNVTLRQVANTIPQKFRNNIYDLYMVSQQLGWNDKPTYIFDELTAYVVGAKCGIENGMPRRAANSIENGLSMLLFGRFFVKLTDVNYVPYILFMLEEIQSIVEKLPSTKPFYNSVMEYI